MSINEVEIWCDKRRDAQSARRNNPINKGYLYGGRLNDLAELGARFGDATPSPAAEQVFGIAELRTMILDAIIGPGSKDALLNCMTLDKTTFSSVLPILYEHAPWNIVARLAKLMTPFHRMTQYIPAVGGVSLPHGHPPLPSTFDKYALVFPNLRRLNGKSVDLCWTITGCSSTLGSNRLELALSILVAETSAIGDDDSVDMNDEDEDASPPVMGARSHDGGYQTAIDSGLHLTDVVIVDESYTHSTYCDMADLLGAPVALGLQRLDVGNSYLTWPDLHVLSETCPNLRFLQCGLDLRPPQRFHQNLFSPRVDGRTSWSGNDDAGNTETPSFPQLESLYITDTFATDNHLSPRLDYQRLPALRHLSLPPAVAFCLGVIAESPTPVATLAEGTAPIELPRLERLGLLAFRSIVADESPLGYARFLVQTYHSRCQITGFDVRMASFDGDEFTPEESQWFRCLLQVRDEILQEQQGMTFERGWKRRRQQKKIGHARVDSAEEEDGGG